MFGMLSKEQKATLRHWNGSVSAALRRALADVEAGRPDDLRGEVARAHRRLDAYGERERAYLPDALAWLSKSEAALAARDRVLDAAFVRAAGGDDGGATGVGEDYLRVIEAFNASDAPVVFVPVEMDVPTFDAYHITRAARERGVSVRTWVNGAVDAAERVRQQAARPRQVYEKVPEEPFDEAGALVGRRYRLRLPQAFRPGETRHVTLELTPNRWATILLARGYTTQGSCGSVLDDGRHADTEETRRAQLLEMLREGYGGIPAPGQGDLEHPATARVRLCLAEPCSKAVRAAARAAHEQPGTWALHALVRAMDAWGVLVNDWRWLDEEAVRRRNDRGTDAAWSHAHAMPDGTGLAVDVALEMSAARAHALAFFFADGDAEQLSGRVSALLSLMAAGGDPADVLPARPAELTGELAPLPAYHASSAEVLDEDDVARIRAANAAGTSEGYVQVELDLPRRDAWEVASAARAAGLSLSSWANAVVDDAERRRQRRPEGAFERVLREPWEEGAEPEGLCAGERPAYDPADRVRVALSLAPWRWSCVLLAEEPAATRIERLDPEIEPALAELVVMLREGYGGLPRTGFLGIGVAAPGDAEDGDEKAGTTDALAGPPASTIPAADGGAEPPARPAPSVPRESVLLRTFLTGQNYHLVSQAIAAAGQDPLVWMRAAVCAHLAALDLYANDGDWPYAPLDDLRAQVPDPFEAYGRPTDARPHPAPFVTVALGRPLAQALDFYLVGGETERVRARERDRLLARIFEEAARRQQG